jgi:hypothetical protein
VCVHGDLELIKYVEDPSTAWFYPRYYGYIVSATLFLATVCQSLCLHQVRFRMRRYICRTAADPFPGVISLPRVAPSSRDPRGHPLAVGHDHGRVRKGTGTIVTDQEHTRLRSYPQPRDHGRQSPARPLLHEYVSPPSTCGLLNNGQSFLIGLNLIQSTTRGPRPCK